MRRSPILASVGVTLLLSSLISMTAPGVVYSVDGALKYLVVRQLCSGDLSLALQSRHEPWVEEA